MTINEDGVEVGMSGGFGSWTDRRVYIVKSVTKKTFSCVELDAVKNIGGPWPSQKWLMADEPSPLASLMVVKKTKKGLRNTCYSFTRPAFHTHEELGDIYYLDPSF